ncbi:TIGR03619 family F420-dependent LLM class oxidoreductase [Mycolicibacterium llatzerense]|uniref:TIGR03619 family F420-dependent LLM class oxidoreductase n=1 Tax=Mycolicibacterium llatzerense TaxID=280871 RepID=UPI0021B5138C|nr:TIGR03619 family F420-dependent LLM class oxidoreductase [Mycolicibacterium llatzerense]MCT7361826.1 LLM class F420-dependent oxidoreductase [Mycolicibacterium llatzerense]
MPTLSLNVPNFGSLLAGDDFGQLIAVCRAADEAGVDRLIVTDHVVMGPDSSAYTWGSFPTEPDAPWLEPLTVLAVLAGQTRRIRLGTGIVIAALRGGAVLAKTAATLDLLSGGRLDLGVGTGWQEKEYEAAGLDFANRGPLLDDALAVCHALWRNAPAAVDRPGIAFSDAYCSPRRHVPVWVSGTLSKAVVHRLTSWGDGWIPIMGAGDDDLSHGITVLRKAFDEAGRDPAGLLVRGRLSVQRAASGTIDLPATMAGAAAQVRVGVTDVSVALQALDPDPAVATAALPELVAAFRAEFG